MFQNACLHSYPTFVNADAIILLMSVSSSTIKICSMLPLPNFILSTRTWSPLWESTRLRLRLPILRPRRLCSYYRQYLLYFILSGSTRQETAGPSPQKRRKLHATFRINHVVDDFVVIQDGLGDIQPQAAAAAVPVPGFVHPVEGSEDTLQIFPGNVNAGILHGKHLALLSDSDHRTHR